MVSAQLSFFAALMIVFAAAVFAAPPLLAPPFQSPPRACSAEGHAAMPCVCCKKDCWYTIAAAATHELGHMPGEAGETEALATLKLIRACMVESCSDVCPRRL